jgi:serine/threonine-protein kinase
VTVTNSAHSLFDTQTSTRLTVCELASGGMGRVDLALRREGSFRRLYAVKRLHPHLRDDPEFRAMFVDEARIAGLIEHPNVVGVLDVGEDADGPFLVMAYVDGLSLAVLLAFAVKNGEPLPLQAAIRIAIDMTKGLHAAHELVDHDGQPIHLVHRDLSPQNVLIGWDGSVRITDFGIAKALGRSSKTATGVIKGKSSYMSPEQLRYQEADRRSDLFSLGIIIYEMVSGERLYKNRDGHDGIRRILEEPPPDIGEVRPEVPATLTALIFRLLAKDPESRIETAAAAGLQLEEVLKEILESEPPLELPPLLEEITGSFREERKQAMSALIAKAERESQGGQRILKVAETPVVDMVASRAARPWLYAGAISLAVAIGVSAWALGRMGAGANTEVVDSPPAEPRDESVVDEVVSEDPLSDDDVAPHMPSDIVEEAADDTTMTNLVAPRVIRPRMRVRRNRMTEAMETGAAMETQGSRWDEWE